MIFLTQVLLQTDHFDRLGRRHGRAGVRGHDTRCSSRGRGQTPDVNKHLQFLKASIDCGPISSGAWAAIASFLLFSMVQFRDGPFVRPHPGRVNIVSAIASGTEIRSFLEGCFGCKPTVRTSSRFSLISKLGFRARDDEGFGSKSRAAAAREKLRRKLRLHTAKYLGTADLRQL